MALALAPYNNAMRLGMGFNSYTQTLCINDAVQKPGGARATDADLRDVSDTARTLHGSGSAVSSNGNTSAGLLSNPAGTLVRTTTDGRRAISQTVKWEASFVEKISDVTKRMDISGGHIIKVDALGAGTKAQGYFVDEVAFKNADLNYLIHVEVTNQRLVAEDVTQFAPLRNVIPARFTEVYGDSFISGFLEGGCFNALVSIKLSDSAAALDALAQTFGGALPSANLAQGMDDLMADNTVTIGHNHKTSITVAWCGGGQVKPLGVKEWTIESLYQAAMSFPDGVALSPQRISAILTKYTALRSFHEQVQRGMPLSYQNSGLYTLSLLDAYTDYKLLVEKSKALLLDLEDGVTYAVERPRGQELVELAESLKKAYQKKKDALDSRRQLASLSSFASVNLNNGDVPATAFDDLLPPNDLVPYKPTVFGIERMRKDAHAELAKIAREVDRITQYPQITNDPEAYREYLSPSIFKLLVPTPPPGISGSVDGRAVQELIKKIKEDALAEAKKFALERQGYEFEISQLRARLTETPKPNDEAADEIAWLKNRIEQLNVDLEKAELRILIADDADDMVDLQEKLEKTEKELLDIRNSSQNNAGTKAKATSISVRAVRAQWGEEIVTEWLQKELQKPNDTFSLTTTDEVIGTKPLQNQGTKFFTATIALSRNTDRTETIVRLDNKLLGGPIEIDPQVLFLFPYPEIKLSRPTTDLIRSNRSKGLNMRLTPTVGIPPSTEIHDWVLVDQIDETFDLHRITFLFLGPDRRAICGIKTEYRNGLIDLQGSMGDVSESFELEPGEHIVAAELYGGLLARYGPGMIGCQAVHMTTSRGRAFGFDLYPSTGTLETAPIESREIQSTGAPLPGYVLKGFWGTHGEIFDRLGLVWGLDMSASSPPLDPGTPNTDPGTPANEAVAEAQMEDFCPGHAKLSNTWKNFVYAHRHLSADFRISFPAGTQMETGIVHPFDFLTRDSVPTFLSMSPSGVDIFRFRVGYRDGKSTGVVGSQARIDWPDPEMILNAFPPANVLALEVETINSDVDRVANVPCRIVFTGDRGLTWVVEGRDAPSLERMRARSSATVVCKPPAPGWSFRGFCAQSFQLIDCLAVVWGRD